MNRKIIQQYLISIPKQPNRFLLENTRYSGNLPQNIVYNGLVYTYNLHENVFINQFGHRIDPSSASVFIAEARHVEQSNLGILDTTSSSSDDGNSKSDKETYLVSIETRDPFGAIAWIYPPYPVHFLQYWTGSEINLFGGSEEISPPYWNTSSVTRVNSGVTLPNGYTHGMILRLSDNVITQNISPIIGITYYFSWYENRTFNAQQVALNAFQGGGDSSNFVGRQILPQINPTPMGNAQIPLGPTAGQTGWVRYAYEFTIQNVNANSSGPMSLGWRTYGGFAGQSYYIGAPQLEIVF